MARTLATQHTTTLFDLMAAVQDNLTVEEEAAGLAVPVVQDLLHRVVRFPPARRVVGEAVPPLTAARDLAA